MDIKTLTRNVDGLIAEFDNLVLDSAMELEKFIAELNREQMWNGETSNDGTISPKYSEDQYFKSKETAARYAEWKKRITPSNKRDADTPNLYINGAFYRSKKTKKKEKYITVESDTQLGRKIQGKFKNINGLNKNSIEILSPDLADIVVKRMLIKLHKQ